MSDRQKQFLMELVTTAAILLVYWVSMQPEWKLQMYSKMVRERLARPEPPDPDELSLNQESIIRKFRTEISAWEHARKSGSAES